jgi:hypothetical protein
MYFTGISEIKELSGPIVEVVPIPEAIKISDKVIYF